ncbi:unnamed protein product [Discula destructiva]
MAEVLVGSTPPGAGPNRDTTADEPPKPQSLVIPPPTDLVSPASSPLADGSGSEEDFYEEDDAQSFIQPAMSPAVTRLTSPKTPMAERMAAMDQVLESYFDGATASKDDESSGDETPTQHPRRREPREGNPVEDQTSLPAEASIPPPQPQTQQLQERIPSPWRTGPKQIVVTHSHSPASRPVLASVLGSSRHRRASSGGAEALRRLSKALPSISMPSNFMPNRIPYFSSSTSSKTDSKSPSPKSSPRLQSPSRWTPKYSSTFSTAPTKALAPKPAARSNSNGALDLGQQPPPDVDRRSLGLRRSTSDESLLYHSLSRMSSFGDDQRFTHVREQVNSRLKAIVDSFDTPSFKLPSMPSTLSLRSPFQKNEFSVEETSSADPSRASSLRASRGPRDPLDSALEALTGDLVILGGYRGSILRSAEAPHRQLWVPIKVGLNVRKVNLELGLDPEDEEKSEETIIPSGMLKNIGPVDISKKLFKRLRECENVRNGKLRVHDYGYDWRLSPHILSKKLTDFLSTLPSNQGDDPTGAFVIAHSLGGVITRHAVNQAPSLFSGVVYAGAPQRCINILGPLRNGDAVLLNEKVLTAHVNFSLRSTFVFLPEDGFCFVDKATGEEYNLDFFNPADWVKHRLCPSVGGPALPPFTPVKRNTSIVGSFLNLSDSLTARARSGSDPAAQPPPPAAAAPAPLRNKITKQAQAHHGLGPQLDASAGVNEPQQAHAHSHTGRATSPPKQRADTFTTNRNLEYLTRTLADTKRFRAGLAHDPKHQDANAYPPIAVIYGKEIPTVYATRVACREAIACADVYDDLVFRSGDGVVLAREAMPPAGYEIARGGQVSTDKGHISILGDLHAVGRAVLSVLRGRAKGIGLGVEGRHLDEESESAGVNA